MKTSSYLEKALFHDQASAIDEYYQEKAGKLFEQSKESSFIELHIQRPSHEGCDSSQNLQDDFMTTQPWESDVDSDSTSDPSSPTQQHQILDGPPRYTGAPVERWRLRDIQELGHYAAVSLLAVMLTLDWTNSFPPEDIRELLSDVVCSHEPQPARYRSD